jgi:3-oxoacyl-[acyl-carrier-protein] synthase II
MVEGFEPADRLPDPRVCRHLSRAGGFGVAAAAEALAAAGADGCDYPAHRRGVAVGATAGRPELQEVADVAHPLAVSGGSDIRRQAPASVLMRDANVAAATIARLGGCRGPAISVSTACAASAQAIGEAVRRIQDGEADLMVAGGYDSLITWLDVLGFSQLGALATGHDGDPTRASRPFERDRSGFVLGEGGVMVVLERLDAARDRGAPILAELAGYAASMNAYRMTDAPPDGGATILAMQWALRDAGVAPAHVDYVVAHGTGTHGNDVSETAALKRVFGAHAPRLAISSPKSMTGHLTAAAGALSLMAATCAIRDGVVPPTTNLDEPDPALDLDYVPNVARRMPVRAALVNAFAFGGTNAALVVRHPDYLEAR